MTRVIGRSAVIDAREGELDALVAAVQASAKYRPVAVSLARRVAAAALRSGHSHKAAVKTSRTKLHQVVGAFLDGTLDLARAAREMEAAVGADDPALLRRCCTAWMAKHPSTRERLPILDALYAAIFARVGPVRHVIDLGCGLNPLAIPWMPLEADCTYDAYDVHADLIAFLGGVLPMIGVRGQAHLVDLTQAMPAGPADLALILKCLPALERVDREAATRLFEELPARHVVVSFPVRSLGGKERGMVAGYASHLQQLVAGRPWTVERLEFPTELVFLLTASGRSSS